MASDGFIGTFSGLRFWPLAPNPDDILIADIAHALAHQCRFGGHAWKFYSVAKHSVHVSQLCPPEHALWGLLHDASEAYLVDLPRPLKLLPEFAPYREAERRSQRAVAVRFGLPEEQPASVRRRRTTPCCGSKLIHCSALCRRRLSGTRALHSRSQTHCCRSKRSGYFSAGSWN